MSVDDAIAVRCQRPLATRTRCGCRTPSKQCRNVQARSQRFSSFSPYAELQMFTTGSQVLRLVAKADLLLAGGAYLANRREC